MGFAIFLGGVRVARRVAVIKNGKPYRVENLKTVVERYVAPFFNTVEGNCGLLGESGNC